ncbi:MAG: class I SAM-dependent methyltransferase [Candidatus Omnitrophica bacterium]|nr:class I SAM-dependent methyltransferase [Candidatus Omnitrophota bacterium]
MKDRIKEFWDQQSLQFGGSHGASWEDRFMIDLEVSTIGGYIKDGDSVLDVGCANGHATFLQAEKHALKSIAGIDFSDNMIQSALAVKAERKLAHMDFSVGDIRQIGFSDSSFDVVYTTRVLINLPTWEEQKIGIRECLRVVKSGGKVVLSEAFWEPLAVLNALRALKGLKSLEEHDFNRYLKKERLEEYLLRAKVSFEVNDFSSIYYLGSRFLRDLLGLQGYENELNKEFFRLEQKFSGGGLGIQQAYVLTKP